ncbi:MAG: hypothetical protein IPP44_07690 [Ideonella sp.]|nr:hypothetical protein [Ideonella sp.]
MPRCHPLRQERRCDPGLGPHLQPAAAQQRGAGHEPLQGDESFDNRRLTQLHAGFIYAPIKNIELGAEYIHGTRKTFDKDTGTMSRFST